jgi:hypothetical protein
VSSPHSDHLIAELDRRLWANVLDGTEGFEIIDALVAAVRDARGDEYQIAAAVSAAKRRLRALNAGLVPMEAVRNAVAAIMRGE